MPYAPTESPLPLFVTASRAILTGLTDESVQIVFAHVEKSQTHSPNPVNSSNHSCYPLRTFPRFSLRTPRLVGTRAQLVLEAFTRRH